MKRKNKKGFTLIELLAVIVILAIIALIAVPVVMNIITKARKSAFKDSAYGIIKAGELYYADRLLEPDGMVNNKIFTFPDGITGLEISGSKPNNGSVVVTKEGKVAIGITDGKYCITKGFDENDITVTENVANCEFPALTLSDLAVNITDVHAKECLKKGTRCSVVNEDSSGTKFTIQVNDEQTEDFYVLADDRNKVTLIMNKNVGSNVAWYESDVNNNDGPIKALTELQSQTNGWTNFPKMTISTFEKTEDAITINENTLSQSFETRARLPKYTEIKYAISAYGNTIPTWLIENLYKTGTSGVYGYWTSTSESNDARVYGIIYNGSNHYFGAAAPNGTSYGVRPVIEISK